MPTVSFIILPRDAVLPHRSLVGARPGIASGTQKGLMRKKRKRKKTARGDGSHVPVYRDPAASRLLLLRLLFFLFLSLWLYMYSFFFLFLMRLSKSSSLVLFSVDRRRTRMRTTRLSGAQLQKRQFSKRASRILRASKLTCTLLRVHLPTCIYISLRLGDYLPT